MLVYLKENKEIYFNNSYHSHFDELYGKLLTTLTTNRIHNKQQQQQQ